MHDVAAREADIALTLATRGDFPVSALPAPLGRSKRLRELDHRGRRRLSLCLAGRLSRLRRCSQQLLEPDAASHETCGISGAQEESAVLRTMRSEPLLAN